MTASPRLRRGDIWNVDFGTGRGSEQGGRRPALVIQNEAGNQSRRYPNTIVLAMSTKGRSIPFHVQIESTELNGLDSVTWIKCEQILTIAKARLMGTQPRGRLTVQEMEQVEIAVKLSLQLP